MDFPKTTLEFRMRSLNTELLPLPPTHKTGWVSFRCVSQSDNGKYTFFFFFKFIYIYLFC